MDLDRGGASRTRFISAGTAITAPVFPCHPAIVAQAWATMASMFPDRLFLGLGTGEEMNEVSLGYERRPRATNRETKKR